MKHKSIILIRRGSPEVLEIIENDLRPPTAFAPEGTGRNSPALFFVSERGSDDH